MNRKPRLSQLGDSKTGKATCLTREKRFCITGGCFALQGGTWDTATERRSLTAGRSLGNQEYFGWSRITVTQWEDILLSSITLQKQHIFWVMTITYYTGNYERTKTNDSQPKYLIHDSKYSTELQHALLGSVLKVSQLGISLKEDVLKVNTTAILEIILTNLHNT